MILVTANRFPNSKLGRITAIFRHSHGLRRPRLEALHPWPRDMDIAYSDAAAQACERLAEVFPSVTPSECWQDLVTGHTAPLVVQDHA